MTNVQSPLYQYIKNQVIMGNFSASDLVVLQSRGYLTENERIELTQLIK